MNDNPFLARRKNAGSPAEKKTSKRLNARLTPASGSIDRFKGDMSVGDFLIENKSTIHNSLTVQLHWLRKIEHEALSKVQQPALSIQFTNGAGDPVDGGAWVCIPERVFNEILKRQETDS